MSKLSPPVFIFFLFSFFFFFCELNSARLPSLSTSHAKLLWASTYQQTESEYYISSKLAQYFARKLAQVFLLSHTTMTLNESHNHLNWYWNVDFSNIYHYATFNRLLFTKSFKLVSKCRVYHYATFKRLLYMCLFIWGFCLQYDDITKCLNIIKILWRVPGLFGFALARSLFYTLHTCKI